MWLGNSVTLKLETDDRVSCWRSFTRTEPAGVLEERSSLRKGGTQDNEYVREVPSCCRRRRLSGAALAARSSEDASRSVLPLEAGPTFDERSPLVGAQLSDIGDPDRLRDDSATRPPMHRSRCVLAGRRRLLENATDFSPAFLSILRAGRTRPFGLVLRRRAADDKKIETDDNGDLSLHGHSGPIRVRRVDDGEMTPSHAAFIETAKALGFPEIDDQNARRSSALAVFR